MQKFKCLLFVLKESNICYYIIFMTVPLKPKRQENRALTVHLKNISYSENNYTLLQRMFLYLEYILFSFSL